MNQGWIKLHRKLLDNPVFSSAKGLKVWIWCLLKASHSLQEFYVGTKKITLDEGEFIYGRESAGGQLKMSPSTVRNYISLLKQDSYLDIKSTNKYSIIKIKNWEDYQQNGQQNGQQNNNRITTEGQQKDTYKKEKNVKNEKKLSSTKTVESEKKLVKKEEFGNPKINQILIALKEVVEVEAFVDSNIERNMAHHCVNLLKKIGDKEFRARLDALLEDPFTAKNCNKIKFIYNNIKGYKKPVEKKSAAEPLTF